MQKQKNNHSPRRPSRVVAVKGSANVPLGEISPSKPVRGADFWRWGDDNQMPDRLALMSRRSTTHRRIINDKADYISGKGFTHESSGEAADTLAALVNCVNGCGDSLRQVFNRLAFDKALFGNAFLEIATDADRSFLSLHHHDASRCRLGRDDNKEIRV